MTVSPRPPWIRRARTTMPAWFSARSGVSKNQIWRGWASTGSSGSPWIVARWASVGIETFSSTVSAPLSSRMISTIWVSLMRGVSSVGMVIGMPPRARTVRRATRDAGRDR